MRRQKANLQKRPAAYDDVHLQKRTDRLIRRWIRQNQGHMEITAMFKRAERMRKRLDKDQQVVEGLFRRAVWRLMDKGIITLTPEHRWELIARPLRRC